MRKEQCRDELGRLVTVTHFEEGDDDVAKIAHPCSADIVKSQDPPKPKAKGKFKLADLSAIDQALAATLMNDQGLSLDEVERRFSKSGGHLAKASFDAAKAAGKSDSDAAKASFLSIIKSRSDRDLATLEAMIDKSRNGWKDFEAEADLLRLQYGLPATEAFTLARKTFEPRA